VARRVPLPGEVEGVAGAGRVCKNAATPGFAQGPKNAKPGIIQGKREKVRWRCGESGNQAKIRRFCPRLFRTGACAGTTSSANQPIKGVARMHNMAVRGNVRRCVLDPTFF